jgi:hypothetical protein
MEGEKVQDADEELTDAEKWLLAVYRQLEEFCTKGSNKRPIRCYSTTSMLE